MCKYTVPIVAFMVILAGCSLRTDIARNGEVPTSKYIRQSDAHSGLIVFVHGVTGNSVETWTNADTKAYWPKLLADDETFNGFDIFVYNYPTPLLDKSYTINQIADDMLNQFTNHRLSDYKQIIFIVHSMGGLVTRAFLVKNPRYAERVKYIHFFATPTTGSALASIGSSISCNPQFKNMMEMTSDDYLADLHRDWLDSCYFIPSYCSYEVLDTNFVVKEIVPFSSAALGCNKPPLSPIIADHVNIVKPENIHNGSYLAFKASFLQEKSQENMKNNCVNAEKPDFAFNVEEKSEIRDLKGNLSIFPGLIHDSHEVHRKLTFIFLNNKLYSIDRLIGSSYSPMDNKFPRDLWMGAENSEKDKSSPKIMLVVDVLKNKLMQIRPKSLGKMVYYSIDDIGNEFNIKEVASYGEYCTAKSYENLFLINRFVKSKSFTVDLIYDKKPSFIKLYKINEMTPVRLGNGETLGKTDLSNLRSEIQTLKKNFKLLPFKVESIAGGESFKMPLELFEQFDLRHSCN